MATYYEVPSLETYWNSQSDTLKEIRDQLGYDSYPVTQQYKPLPDRHPLLQNVPRKKPAPQRQGSTPPAQLPKIRGTPPPEISGHDSPNLHSSKYNVIPPLKSKRAFASPVPQKPDANDSWGEEESSDEETFPMPGYHGYPYPMVMYPYPLVMAPPPQVTPHKSKSKKGKKKVRYQNTPIYLSSREHTKHEPMVDSSQREPSDLRPSSVLQRYQYQPVTSSNQPLDVTDYWDLVPKFSKNFVDTFVDECLDDVILPDLLIEVLSEEDHMPPSHPYYPASFYYCEDFLDEEIPKLVREVVHDASYQMVGGQILRHQNKHDALEEFLNNLLEDVIYKESTRIVKDVAKDIVNEHMEKAAAYDMIQDMIRQVIHEMGPDVIDEALTENMLDDLLEENVIQQEVSEQSQEVAIEVLTHYSNKVRKRDIRQIKSSSGEKLKDSLCLDYLLAYIARQGELWTEGEHANKLLDEITLNILLTEFAGVQQKKRATVDNKPVRRHYEKIVTDVTLDVLLEEISQSLDEDMADLDEYEMGLENPDINYVMPKELKKWLEAR